jgi:hypothetical protein
MIGPLLLAILFWVVYFSIIFFICRWFYLRLSGPEPKPHAQPVIIQGQPISAREIWERRKKRLQRLFVIVALILMSLPLFLPLILPQF